MALNFNHLSLITDTNEENQEIADFFAGVLGLTVRGNAGEGYAEVDAGEIVVSLHRGGLIDDIAPHGGTLLQFASDDVKADIEQIRARGGRIVLEPMETDWGTTSAYVAGPHGVLVELCKFHTT
ncbi:putative enzyme related to lactoylglutathione lyase [Kribbella amoyensis]|uniref:Putative enzyme related to lactoylglutathione lyase n=1 Tax=Kribbella amoyensis TaxID=996641 RepID=A0A561BXL3_9ACTN|nr:VOC family protein [Kribbella amoyensis]TWD83629.1 putative enzyme related to lactoylglutathione lyase [Kribbella amoyensis]